MKGRLAGRLDIEDFLRLLLCSTVLAFLALGSGYLIEDRLAVVAISSIGSTPVFAFTLVKKHGASSVLFFYEILVIAIGVFIYLTCYYIIAGIHIGSEIGLSPLEFLLAFMRSGVFVVYYLIYVILYLVVYSLLLLLVLFVTKP